MRYKGRLRDPLVDRLFDAVLMLETPDECYRFFDDLCTVGEIKAMALRLEVAKMLDAGKTYDDIAAETGMSTATISRIRRFLSYGSDGYRLVIDRLTGGGARRTRAGAQAPPAKGGKPSVDA